MKTYNELKFFADALVEYRDDVIRAAENLTGYPDETSTMDEMTILDRSSSKVESAIVSLMDSRKLIATFEAGDQFAEKFLEEYEKLADCEFEHTYHDTTTYIFGPEAAEADINEWAERSWPDRVVRYTDSGGIEFDFSDEGAITPHD